MRRPRVSVGMLMAIVGFIAIQIAVARHYLLSEGYVSALFVLPVVTVLGLGALFVMGDLRRKGETTAFLVGFEAIGGSTLCFAVQLSPLWIRASVPVAKIFAPLFPTFPGVEFPERLLLVALCSLPIFLIALGGGWLANKLRLTVTIGTKPAQAT
jgi:hypothetical protein